MTDVFFDSHCHLDYDYEGKSVSDLIQEAKTEGVNHLITVGTTLDSFSKIQLISEKHPQVYHTIGVHPHDVKDIQDSDLDKIEELSKNKKCVAVGEIGLDYHYDHSPREVQIKRFRDQFEIALKINKPLVIHAREAEEDLSNLLKDYVKKIPKNHIPGVIHCFTGTKDFGKYCLSLGFYISFSGILTFKTAEDLRECAREFPMERILIETDSPFLAPIPFRGKQCQPKMVVKTAEKLAEIKKIPLSDIARITVDNTKKVFRI